VRLRDLLVDFLVVLWLLLVRLVFFGMIPPVFLESIILSSDYIDFIELEIILAVRHDSNISKLNSGILDDFMKMNDNFGIEL
jgi:hypothetical protein